MSQAFSQKLEQGKIGESLIANWLRSRNNWALPVYEVEMGHHKGPRLYPPIVGGMVPAEIIAPDLLVFNGKGKVFWIEAKHKSAFTPHRISGNVLTTGIDKNHFEHYCHLAAEWTWPVWLLFLHRGQSAANCPDDTPTGLFGNDIAFLKDHVHHEHKNWGRYGMVYWAKDDLKQLATVEEVLAAQPKVTSLAAFV